MSYFRKKRKNFFAFFFLRTLSGVTNFNTSPMAPLFENFWLDALNNEQKPYAKNRSTGPVRNRLTGQSTGVDFEIYRSGRENPDRFHLYCTRLRATRPTSVVDVVAGPVPG